MAAEPLAVPAPDVSTFGRRLAYIRWFHRLSREAFIKRLDLDVTQGSLANWENDKPCDSKAEVAAAIEREWPEFPVLFTLYGRGTFGNPGPDPKGGESGPDSPVRPNPDSAGRRSKSRYATTPLSPIGQLNRAA